MPSTKETRDRKRLYLINNGLCTVCGDIRGDNGTKTKCRICVDDHKAKYQSLNGYCINCKLQVPNGYTYLRCEQCRRIQADLKKKRHQEYKRAKKCVQCGASDPITTECYECYFKRFASFHLDDRNRWQEIRQLWETQQGICPYSGVTLQLGINASLDHILPKSRYPELAKDINNLEWVSLRINRMKQDLTRTEFLDMCKVIITHEETKKERNV